MFLKTLIIGLTLFNVACIAEKIEDLPKFSLPSVRFGDLLVNDKTTALHVSHALTTLGGLEITEIPKFRESREKGLKNLAECLEADSSSPAIEMNDGSRRLTTAGSSAEKMTGECGEAAAGLRSVVDGAVNQLMRVLDSAVDKSLSERAATPLKSPSYTFEDIGRYGRHLEHMHSYFPPKYIDESMSEVATMDMHTDSGLFIAMTTGLYTTSETTNKDESPANGLYVQLPSKSLAQVDSSDDSLIIMVGAGGANWLSPVLGAPLRALPHALKIPPTLSSANTLWSRSWYGKMYLPPSDASLNNIPGKETTTYGEYRQNEIAAVAEATAQGQAAVQENTLPAACGGHSGGMKGMGGMTGMSHGTGSTKSKMDGMMMRGMHSSPTDALPYSHVVKNDLCGSDNSGVMCWTQCMDPSKLPCGTSAECVDTVTGEVVDGYDHCPESDMSLCELQCVGDIDVNGGGNTTGSNDDFCYGKGVTMYMDGFYSTLQEEKGDTACVNLFFTEWTLDTGTKYSLGCLGMFLSAVFVEFLVSLRKKIAKSVPWSVGRDFVMVFLHGVQVFLGYLLMLAAMTYNVELLVMVILGLMTGYAAFNLSSPPKANLDPCCAETDVEDMYAAQSPPSKEEVQTQESCCGGVDVEDVYNSVH